MRKVLFIVSSDPRTSHRPAEAIRIAAGAGAWGRAEVNVCLTGSAVSMLCDSEGLKDAEQFVACLPIIGDAGRPIYVLKSEAQSITNPAVEEVDIEGVAELALRHDVVARF